MTVSRTFVFVDISGFTNYTATRGDEAAGELLSAWRRVTRDLASSTGVRIAKWLGDGCMMVGVDTEDAVKFALRLRAESSEACAPLAVRMGIATGRVLLFEGDDHVGGAVNTAARLCQVAEPLEILMPADQASGLPEGVVALAHAPLALRGLAASMPVVALAGDPAAADGDAGELWTRAPFSQ